MSDDGLEVARSLIRAGMPVFAAPPAMRNGTWDPRGGTDGCGYWLPKEWQRTVPAEEWLDRSAGRVWQEKAWRPGWALCALMGVRCDGLDVDPRNGGSESIAALRAAGMVPRTTGLQWTPSGGWHALIAPLGVGSEDAVRPGVDVKGGRPDGSGRGFLFIAPTLKRSKTTGHPEPYRWESPPDLAELDGDTSGDALASLIAAPRASRTSTEDEPREHTGPIADGDRHDALVSYAGRLRHLRLTLNEAEALYRRRWEDCAQPPAARYPVTWDEALDKLRDVFTRYPPGSEEEQYDPTDLLGDKAQGANHEAPRQGANRGRRVRLTPASAIKPLPVRWLWQDRVPVGEVTLTPGRGGMGKSTFHAWLIAAITRGKLAGANQGAPRACIIAAAEDSWQRTIVPRLIAAGADLDLVYRVDVVTEGDAELSLTLPHDCDALAAEIARICAAVLSVDPLMSTIAGALDTHKDREVRHALEPLARLADRTGCAVLGNAHFNKSSGSDPLSLVTGSAAFGNVARAALGFARDTEAEDGSCVVSQIKNNLGRVDLPSLRYVIEEATVETEEGPAAVGRLVMVGESDRSVGDILRDRGDEDDRTDRDEAAEWIRNHLTEQPNGEAPAGEVLKAGKALGYAERTLQRARKRAGVETRKSDFGKGWVWALIPDVEDLIDGERSEGVTKAPKAPASETQTPTAPSWRLRDEDDPDWLNRKAEAMAG